MKNVTDKNNWFRRIYGGASAYFTRAPSRKLFSNPVSVRIRNVLLISLVSVLLVIVLAVVFCSPLIKYLVEKYDMKYTGREINMKRAYVNPLTGYFHFSNLVISELKSDSVFLSADELVVNISMMKLLFKTIEISEFIMIRPRGIIIQNKSNLNFDDLVAKITSDRKPGSSRTPFHFNILSIKITDGEFHYREQLIPINYFIRKVNFESTGTRWDADTLGGNFSFSSGTGSGAMQVEFTLNLKTNDYRFSAAIQQYDLNIIEQYLTDLTNYGCFSASLDAHIKAAGSFNDEEDVTASGLLSINDFHFGKNPKDDYAAFDNLTLAVLELSPKNQKYLFDSVSLNHPYFKYELYDNLDNLETMFGKAGSNITSAQGDPSHFNLILEIARYVKVLARNFFQSYYRINRLAVYNGNFKFNDYALNEKYAVGLGPLFVLADSIDKNHDRVLMSFQSAIQPFGYSSVLLSINPKDTGDFDMSYHIQKLNAALFNPYLISYTSFPLDRGTLELNGTWKVRNGIIESTNHLLLLDPRVTKRIRKKDSNRMPLPLIMSLIRERGNMIDYEIPITGNLKSPHFNLHDVLTDLLGNIFIKPATTPYRMEVKHIERDIEKAQTLQWQMKQNALRPNQEKFVEKMAKYLSKNPDASITIYPQQYSIKEKEYILFYEAKKKYFLSVHELSGHSFNASDSEHVEKMPVKDSLFMIYLNKQANDTMLFTIQDQCLKVIGQETVNARFNQLNKERENAFLAYFKEGDVNKQVHMVAPENTVPYNGFSYYKIEYKGGSPKSLQKAYQKMNDLNDEAPRDKYKEERSENKTAM